LVFLLYVYATTHGQTHIKDVEQFESMNDFFPAESSWSTQ